MSRPQPMSMEAVLDQERREVLALLEGQSAARNKASSSRPTSPYASPRSPMRSMLDIGGDSPAPLNESSPVSQSAKSLSLLAPVRSMLDVGSRPTTVLSNPSSPTELTFRPKAANTTHPRSLSDAATRPADFGPRLPTARQDLTADYQFSGIITNNAGQALPKRVTQGGKRSAASSSMAEVMRGSDVANLVLPGDRGRHSVAGPSMQPTSKSKSPHSRLSMRSMSPHTSLLSGRALSPSGKSLAGENQAKNFEYANAYKRLTNANFARSGGSLGELTLRKVSDEVAGGGRLEKDYLGPDGELLPEESSDDLGASSSDDEGERGRKTARRGEKPLGQSNGREPVSPETQRKALSLLAAAEEERLAVAAGKPVHQYKSLLDEPEIMVTNPSGERIRPSKSGVHPTTSFDNPPRSTSLAPLDSDTEADITDIKRAQKLSFSTTQIMSYPESHRTIQIITRGEYGKIVQEAEDDQRTLRKYLVATDMSEESTHALEWAIGTVLRDGDTLIAIYCVDEETGIAAGDGAMIPDDAKAMKEQAVAINAVTASKPPLSPGGSMLPLQQHRPSPLMHASDLSSVSPSPAPSRERTKAEEERYRAVHDISERVTKLLRKTRLQVRAIVEVLHCKNPKHLITEVIDVVNPTLVILGSRGRSALKGVILGSFSNYLVTKSSVPVMVARKRLRKQSKYKRLPATQQVNNISNPAARSLANAKID